MSGGFSFPPPPPPPPKAAWSPPTNGEQYASQDRGQGRGRGRGRGRPNDSSGRTRGHGDWTSGQNQQPNQYPPRGTPSRNNDPTSYRSHGTDSWPQKLPSGSFVNPAFVAQSGEQNRYSNASSMSPSRTIAGHKRKLDALRPPIEGRKPKPQTAPAVPSFGAPILPSKPAIPASAKPNVASNTRKSLGLAPAAVEDDAAYPSSEDEKEVEDVDEEALHAELGTKLTFEHNGVVLTLNNAAELAAWQDERRKNWPTQARMMQRDQEKRKTGEERRRLLTTTAAVKQDSAAAERQNRREVEKTRHDSQSLIPSPNRTIATRPPLSDLDKARKELAKQEAKLTALRKQVMTSQATLDDARAREATRNTAAREQSADRQLEAEVAATNGESDVSSVLSESSVVSSGSPTIASDSDDDAPPEVSTTKAPIATAEQRGQRLCRYFAASGYCRDGDACGFRHELAPGAQIMQHLPREDRPPHLDPSTTTWKSIYQRLMEQQQEEEDRLALKVIKHLGKAGFFAAVSDT